MEAAQEDLGAMDLLFAALGVATAFSIGRQSGSSEAEPPEYQPGSYDPIPEQVKPEADGQPKT